MTPSRQPIPSLTPEDIRIAWETGRLTYRLRNIQRQIRNAAALAFTRSIKFYLECTRRAGKSSFGLSWLNEDCIKTPGVVNAFFAPVKEGLRDYILPIIEQTFIDCPHDLRPQLDSSLTLSYPNGSKIIFRGSNNQQHRVRRGNAFHRVFVDEGRDVDDLDNLIDSVVVPSLFSTDGRVMISSTPADSEDHPLYSIKQAAEKEGCYFHCTIYDANKADPDAFPEERIAQWKRETTDTVAWEREYLAKWVKDPTKTVIPEWDSKYAEIPKRDEFFKFYHKYASIDSGVTDKTVALLGYYDFKRAALIIEREGVWQHEQVRTDRIANWLHANELNLDYQATHKREELRHIPANEKVFRRVADNNNLILVQDLNAMYNLDFFATHKDSLDAMINMVREWVKDGRILVNWTCKELTGCLSNALWDKNRKELAKSKTYGHFDALMALVYLVRNVDTHTNPIPEYYGKSWATHAGVPVNANAPQHPGDALVRAFTRKMDTQEARADFVKGRMP